MGRIYSMDPKISNNKDKKKYSLDDYEVIEMIGKGSFGKVYKVKSKIDNKL